MYKNNVIDFNSDFSDLSEDINDVGERVRELDDEISKTNEDIQEIIRKLKTIGCDISPLIEEGHLDIEIESLNNTIDDILKPELRGDIRLSAADLTVSIISGVIASVIDIFFVGTPEVVKIYRGGENFDGSILTKALRKVGEGDGKFSCILKWLSEKCTVPYDISTVTDTVTPNNHRLRSFAHDPLLGLLFAVVDIIMGTATVIDNSGHIKILVNDKDYPPIEKYLAVLYYLGHLVSDAFTARGLPIPGFFLTQFFTNNDDSDSIAQIAEQMYKDGYDLRHLVSMSVPVAVKNLIINAYITLSRQDNGFELRTIAEKEIDANKSTAYKYKLRLTSDAVCCSGNVLKFFLPPTTGNITALNLSEWASCIKDTIIVLKYQFREKDIEKVIANRDIINDNWKALI